ncbi:DUF2332 domain-containing protein [Actinoplanes sp. TRM 88003]|uniref:DUF2332 domain-containing protein n=1 Tax=Paractinoplanes aksuensis TaxID=2939490 RepID=A0ABT1DI09_9ACTN|nr:DUF2332 domain-containing protein [Actinoplanes aksuensis]MCO8269456.1 DUF2332 domain-containing protein [Actinoplanes aksuensis]
MTTADWYVDFAERQARDVSPTYERLARAVAGDPELLTLLDTVPEPKRQPNLLFGVVQWLAGPVDDYDRFRAFVTSQWARVAAQLRVRATQTNEIGRSALLLPVLAALPQPLALIEVGASAGLNLYPDKYSYRYGDGVLGQSGPLLDCAATGLTPPAALPQVVWRAGIDLNPLDITAPADRDWLEALIWPEHDHRRDRLRQAAAIAAADPPRLIRGDLVDELPALVAEAPGDATRVVFHTSMLYQVPLPRRRAFLALVGSLPVHWVAVEDPEVIEYADLPAPPGDGRHKNVLALDGKPLAWTEGHGRSLSWFGA